MIKLLWIACGGALGAISRYKLSSSILSVANFPMSTLCVNLIGCFAIGLMTIWLKNSPNLKLFVVIGFLGSFTTYSAFSLEALQMLQRSDTFKLALYITLHVVAGLVLVNLGMKTGSALKL